MKTIIRIISFTLGLLVFVSCEKEIEFNGEISSPMIVVNSYVSPDSAIYAHLTKSKFFLSSKEGFEYIDNADVSVFVNRIFREKLNFTANGLYTGNLKPLIGDTIQLIVEVEGYEQVESTTIVQSRANVLSVDTTLVKYTDTYNSGEVIYFNLKIKDQADEKNYYRLTAKIRNEILIEDSLFVDEYFTNFALEGFDSQSGSIIDLFENSMNTKDHHLITDDLFNGKELVFKISTGFYRRVVPEQDEPKDIATNDNNEYIILNLQTISKDMYLYLKSKESAEQVLNNFFTEPVQIYNNINNGIGIFGSYANNEYKHKF